MMILTFDNNIDTVDIPFNDDLNLDNNEDKV